MQTKEITVNLPSDTIDLYVNGDQQTGFGLFALIKDELMLYENVKLTEQSIDNLAEMIVRSFAVKCGIKQA